MLNPKVTLPLPPLFSPPTKTRYSQVMTKRVVRTDKTKTRAQDILKIKGRSSTGLHSTPNRVQVSEDRRMKQGMVEDEREVWREEESGRRKEEVKLYRGREDAGISVPQGRRCRRKQGGKEER